MPGIARYAAGLLVLTAFAQTPPADLVLHFEVNLVQVDALVTDSRGSHVPNLKAEDFEVLQDGKPQKITHFSYVAANPPRAAQSLPPVVPTRAEVRRTLVFMLDDARMSFADFHYAQEAIRRYLDADFQPNDLAAIARTSYGSGALQIFTSDPHWLQTALRRMIWRPPLSTAQPPVLDGMLRAIYALTAYPGRKSIVLISPGLLDPGFWNRIRFIADSANRASVTIETIDCRGLPVLQPDASMQRYDAKTSLPPSEFAPVGNAAGYFRSQDPLAYLAQATAGLFLHENNDIAGQVRNAVADGEGYYLIGWYPGAGAFQLKQPKHELDYHRVKIGLRHAKGLTVRTRDGFFAFPGSGAQTAYTPAQQMNQALFSPFRSGDIDVRLTASTGFDPQDGSYIDSLLHILPAGIDFRELPGRPECRTAGLEILTSPEPLDAEKTPTGRIDGSIAKIQVCRQLDTLLRDGLVVAVRTRIPAPGPYQVRVAVRNVESGATPSIGQPKELIHRAALEPNQTPIGSANQIVDVPDPGKQNPILTGITLESGTFPEPVAAAGATYRAAKPADPAVRQFHPGDTLTYSFNLRSKTPATYQLAISRDGTQIAPPISHSALANERITDTYTLSPATDPGHYILGIKSGQAEQWIDFEVVK